MSNMFINMLYVHKWCDYPAEGHTITIRHANQDDLQAMYRISEAGHIGWSLQQLQVCK